MLAYQVPANGVKIWMNHLLRETTFDAFEVRGVSVVGVTRLDLDGVRYPPGPANPPAAAAEVSADHEKEARAYCSWGMLREDVFHFIRGRQRPRTMKIVFAYPQRALAAIHGNAAALFLNVAFENDCLICTTAVSQKTFTLDKAVDGAWDGHVEEWLRKIGLPLA